jgi:hypothetical protein
VTAYLMNLTSLHRSGNSHPTGGFKHVDQVRQTPKPRSTTLPEGSHGNSPGQQQPRTHWTTATGIGQSFGLSVVPDLATSELEREP